MYMGKKKKNTKHTKPKNHKIKKKKKNDSVPLKGYLAS